MSDLLHAYFQRIGFERPGTADLESLEAVMRAHRYAIPFENLDIPLGRGVSIDPEAVEHKLLARRRGGYCFEQNSLFLRILLELGYEARPLLGRVWVSSPTETPPRTHTMNLVRLNGEEFIVDVGFGGTFAPILPLVEDRPVATIDGVRHRLVRHEGDGWMLERDAGAGWARQYSFTLDRVWPSDLEVGNHFAATRPGTRFTTLRVASMPLPDGLVSLVDRTLTVTRRGASEASEVGDAERYRTLLADRFGITLEAREVEALGLF